MRKVSYFILAFILLSLTACHMVPETLQPPRTVTINIKADDNINPNNSGQPQPLYIMLFELKNASAFKRVSFFNLYQKPDATLGADMLSLQKVYIKPGDEFAIKYEVTRNAKYLGIIAAYTNIDAAQWRTVVTLDSSWGNEPIWLDVHELEVDGKN